MELSPTFRTMFSLMICLDAFFDFGNYLNLFLISDTLGIKEELALLSWADLTEKANSYWYRDIFYSFLQG